MNSTATQAFRTVVTATLSVRAGLVLNGLEVVVDVGGVQRRFTLDAKGKSTPKGVDALTVGAKLDDAGATLGDPAAKVTVKISKSDLASALCDEGVAAATTGKKLARSIVATVVLDGRHFRAVVPMTYDNASGKSAKLKR